jgi:hypothetical protein
MTQMRGEFTVTLPTQGDTSGVTPPTPTSRDAELNGRWKRHQSELENRHKLLFQVRERLNQSVASVSEEQALTLAATDLFVEHAQSTLKWRANTYLAFGAILSISVVVGLLFVGWHIAHLDIKDIQDAFQFTQRLIQSVSATAIALAGAYFAAGIARACLHEGAALYQRRHALRFGRLYVYMKLGDVSISDLDQAFQWHGGAETAFRDIKVDALTQTLLHKFVETLPATITAITGAATKKAEEEAKKSPSKTEAAREG